MSKSLIQIANQSLQTVALDGVLSLGSVIRRFGCNCRLNGNAIEVNGEGYYTVSINVTVLPTVAGPTTIALYANGVQVAGATARGSVSTAGNPVTLPIDTTVRVGCCDEAISLTCVLTEGAGNVSNVTARVVKA